MTPQRAHPPNPTHAGSAATGHELLGIAGLTAEAATAKLGSSLSGLSRREAARRFARYGPNAVAHEERKNPLLRLAQLLLTPLSLLLMGLAIVNALIGEINSAIVIALMVLLSSLLSFVQEYRSGKAADALRAMVSTTTAVLRKPDAAGAGGAAGTAAEPSGPVEIPLARVVPGDIVHLSAGDIVPADARIVSARDLFVNQAALTG